MSLVEWPEGNIARSQFRLSSIGFRERPKVVFRDGHGVLSAGSVFSVMAVRHPVVGGHHRPMKSRG